MEHSRPNGDGHDDPTEEYVRSALRDAAQAYQPDRTAMVNRVASGRTAAATAAPRARWTLLGFYPAAAAAAVAVILVLSMVAVRSARDGDSGPIVAAPPPSPTASASAPPTPTGTTTPPAKSTTGTSPTTTRRPSGKPTSTTFLTTDGAMDANSVDTWSQSNVTLTNTKPLVELAVTIKVAMNPSTADAGRYTTVPNSDMTMTVTRDETSLTYEFVLRDGKKLQPGNYVFAAQFIHRSGRSADADTYSVVARTASVDTKADLGGNFR